MGRIRAGLTLCIVAIALVALAGCGGEDETTLPGPAVPAEPEDFQGGTTAEPPGDDTGTVDPKAYADCVRHSVTDAQLAACVARVAEGSP